MKNLKLSTELASSVLGLNVVYIESCEHRDGIIGIWTDMNTKPIEEINIYEFAYKCKEWAYTQGYILKSEINGCLVCDRNTFMGSDTEWFNGISEIETIIKACEWILNNEKNPK